MTRRAPLALVVLLLAAPARAEPRDVAFPAPDGVMLQGTFSSVAKGGPGVLLLHQCDADRRSYDQLALMLNTAGYNVLAFDFRKGMAEKRPGDVDAALAFLTSQNTVIARALGVVGGSCGVNQAIQASRRHPDIRTLVLLSGGTNADGEAHIRASRQLPIFGVASEEDGTAPESIRKIVGLSAHPDSRAQMLKNAGHAAEMLAKQDDLGADIVIWFRANLPVAGYGLPPAIR
jgi:dienelactone hydrolase